jgi:chemotaxis-related protein WspD
VSEEERGGMVSCWREIGVSGDFSCARLTEAVHCRNCEEYNKAGRQLLDREIPEGFLDEWTRNLADVKEAEVAEAVSVIVFRVREEWLALRTVCLQETVNGRSVHDVPSRSNSIFKGVVNVNGELLLCMSAADVLESGAEARPAYSGTKAYERMLVVKFEGERYVFPVDEVLGIHRISVDDFDEPPATISKSPTTFVKSIFAFKEKRVGLLDENSFHNAFKRSLSA